MLALAYNDGPGSGKAIEPGTTATAGALFAGALFAGAPTPALDSAGILLGAAVSTVLEVAALKSTFFVPLIYSGLM